MTTPSYPIGGLTMPVPAGRLSPERARKLHDDLKALHTARVRALAESRTYPVTGGQA